MARRSGSGSEWWWGMGNTQYEDDEDDDWDDDRAAVEAAGVQREATGEGKGERREGLHPLYQAESGGRSDRVCRVPHFPQRAEPGDKGSRLAAYAVDGIVACRKCGETDIAVFNLHRTRGNGTEHYRHVADRMGWKAPAKGSAFFSAPERLGFPQDETYPVQVWCHQCNTLEHRFGGMLQPSEDIINVEWYVLEDRYLRSKREDADFFMRLQWIEILLDRVGRVCRCGCKKELTPFTVAIDHMESDGHRDRIENGGAYGCRLAQRIVNGRRTGGMQGRQLITLNWNERKNVLVEQKISARPRAQARLWNDKDQRHHSGDAPNQAKRGDALELPTHGGEPGREQVYGQQHLAQSSSQAAPEKKFQAVARP